ncbi:MAG: osmosensitive channel signal transduction histidine kinase, partial [Acidimicrobiia bacterium]|nr:osmosensitive channel signal transduction histidine kinase [Acidimicrobiia bacterium]
MTRGNLRIYLGAAPGVGKTYAMLNEGWRGYQRGKDVVVGFVETHGRGHTAEQLRSLPVIERRVITYRDATLEEMDVDAVLARRPEVVLVDELAHTNVPGSRFEKRWQDVAAFLDAGINVISTVNIQHLESLNDVVESITGIRQLETVPDAFVRSADQLELIDMAPEALRRRLAHGNVYAPEKVDAALSNYFRPGNLAALRELALLWVADRVEAELQNYRQRHGIAAPWETREHVAVALTGAPGSDNLIRRAARIASRTKSQLVGIHVRTDDGLADGPSGPLAEHRQLLEDLGGTYRETVGADVARALVQSALAHHATQLVLGASQRSRWSELIRGSTAAAVLREAAGVLDVHVVSTAAAAEVSAPQRLPDVRVRWSPMPSRRRLAGLLLAILGLPLLTLVLVPWRAELGFTSTAFFYLLFVLAVSTVGGAIPAGLAAVGGFVLLNWYFADPVHTLSITHSRDVIALLAFLTVGAVVSVLVDLTARRSSQALRARAEARALAAMAGSLLREGDPVPELLANLAELFRLDGASIVEATGAVVASVGVDPTPATLVMPLGPQFELRVRGSDLGHADREVLGAFAAQVAVALESRRLQASAAEAAALVRTNELRDALLGAVSHDLRTPLASIKASASSLLSPDVAFTDEARRLLLETVVDEADRLNSLVGNLLDMSRLQAGAVAVRLAPVSIEDVIGGALRGVPDRGHPIALVTPEDLPWVNADSVLLERVVANLVSNAIEYSPPGEVVRIEGGLVGEYVHLRVIDRGRGIPVAERERVFQPFQRLGDSPNGSGVGLGLAVARGFTTAMGGDLTI